MTGIDRCGSHLRSTQAVKGKAIWFTGLSGSGKTTLARSFCSRMKMSDKFCIPLDGDDMRKGVNAGLGFSHEDRIENIRRIAEIAKLLIDNGIICIVSTISPYAGLRSMAKQIIGEEHFYEVYINAPLEVCEQRDVKGLYSKARQNQIGSFTGIHDEYSPPETPDLEIRTDSISVEDATERLLAWFSQNHKDMNVDSNGIDLLNNNYK
jgi:adenylylsulfate kinase